MDKLSCTIETIRSELYETAKNKSLTDPEVVRLSQLLDRLLNEYRASLAQ